MSESRIHSRIDHCIVNDEWWQRFSDSVVCYKVPSMSDHGPLVLAMGQEK